MKKSALLIFAVAIVAFSTSCAKGSGCYYNTTDANQEVLQEMKESPFKFVAE